MNNTIKIAIAAGTAVVALGTYVWSEGTVRATIDRFPEIDPKVARKAYWKMTRAIASGSFGDVSSYDTAKLDSIFMTIVNDGHYTK